MRIPVLSGVLLAMLVLDCPARAADQPFTEATAYCQAAGTADAPDARYTGPAVPDWMVSALYTKDEIKAQKKSIATMPSGRINWRPSLTLNSACVILNGLFRTQKARRLP